MAKPLKRNLYGSHHPPPPSKACKTMPCTFALQPKARGYKSRRKIPSRFAYNILAVTKKNGKHIFNKYKKKLNKFRAIATNDAPQTPNFLPIS